MKRYFLFLACLLALHCGRTKPSPIDRLITNGQYSEAVTQLVSLPPQSNQKVINHYYALLDSILRIESNRERDAVPQQHQSHGKGTLTLSYNPEFRADTSQSRELLCRLWIDYIRKYPDGLFLLSFQKQILSFGRPRYQVIQDSSAQGFIQSKDPELLSRGSQFLGDHAFLRGDYNKAKAYYAALLIFGDDKAGNELLLAECNYLSGDLAHARFCANAACESATARAKEAVCKVASYWLKDYDLLEKDATGPKKKHVFIEYY